MVTERGAVGRAFGVALRDTVIELRALQPQHVRIGRARRFSCEKLSGSFNPNND
jgi:hypothetical protein